MTSLFRDTTLEQHGRVTLDPQFRPAVLENRRYLRHVRNPVPVVFGLERENGTISHYETVVGGESDASAFHYLERVLKFLLWARGGWRLYFGGPRKLGEQLQRCYAADGARAFDAELMGRVYEKPFEVVITDAESVPSQQETEAPLGGHLDGCRIGFDLGASDYKIAAVNNGGVVYSEEFPWNPREQADPEYHYQKLDAGIETVARSLPRVDAIGGSTAGVVVNNRIMVASVFRSVPSDRFEDAKNIFLRLQKQWRVPLTVANDGDVTALAGGMSLGKNGVLGIAMGSSQAAGYLTPRGRITGWLNELAFAPVDYHADAPADEWSGDQGVGALYFSQQAVNKLLPAAGIQLPDDMGLPERLNEVQSLMAKGGTRAAEIYDTIGVYLGYGLPHYAEYYDFQHVLILGRVMTGAGGERIMSAANDVLRREFPELAERIQLHLPDEKSRRVGQAVAAASLPELERAS